MARRVAYKDLTDDEIIRFLRFKVIESAPATYTQISYDTQLSIDRGLIWMIHWIEFTLSAQHIDDPAVDTTEQIQFQITRESQSAMLGFDDADLITKQSLEKDRADTIGTPAGPVVILDHSPKVIYFPLALPFAAQNIHVGLISSAAAAKSVSGRIAYTLRRVSDKFFYRVAQALIS